MIQFLGFFILEFCSKTSKFFREESPFLSTEAYYRTLCTLLSGLLNRKDIFCELFKNVLNSARWMRRVTRREEHQRDRGQKQRGQSSKIYWTQGKEPFSYSLNKISEFVRILQLFVCRLAEGIAQNKSAPNPGDRQQRLKYLSKILKSNQEPFLHAPWRRAPWPVRPYECISTYEVSGQWTIYIKVLLPSLPKVQHAFVPSPH